jgi:multicomponent Na+:H+ antiporter subunit C
VIPDFFVGRYPYLFIALLVVIGVYGMVVKRNLLKKIIGMTVFQTAIYLLFVQGAKKTGASIPVYSLELGSESGAYMNPLPHVLVLTAIVVGVAITGVAISLLLVIYRRFGTLDEAEILRKMRESA